MAARLLGATAIPAPLRCRLIKEMLGLNRREYLALYDELVPAAQREIAEAYDASLQMAQSTGGVVAASRFAFKLKTKAVAKKQEKVAKAKQHWGSLGKAVASTKWAAGAAAPQWMDSEGSLPTVS